MESNKPPPGSPRAIEQGCTCPVMDNYNGKGNLGEGKKFGWYININCPIHKLASKIDDVVPQNVD